MSDRLRLRQGSFETARLGGCFGVLCDALPDHWGRRVIARHGGLGEPSDFDLLLLGPDDRCGAVGFGRGVEPPAPQRRFNRTLDLERIKQAADGLLCEQPELAGSARGQVEELLGQAGTSMGGARPKIRVEVDNALWLAKFPAPNDRWNQPRVEHGLLLLARSCGLQVAGSRLTRVGDADVLLVKRFDRDWSESGYQRHRMVSALTLLQAEDSATDRSNLSYLLLAAAGRFLLQPAEAEAIATRIFSTVASSWEASLRDAFVRPGDCQRLSRAFLFPGLQLDPEVRG